MEVPVDGQGPGDVYNRLDLFKGIELVFHGLKRIVLSHPTCRLRIEFGHYAESLPGKLVSTDGMRSGIDPVDKNPAIPVAYSLTQYLHKPIPEGISRI
jgi:hypothetical protein